MGERPEGGGGTRESGRLAFLSFFFHAPAWACRRALVRSHFAPRDHARPVWRPARLSRDFGDRRIERPRRQAGSRAVHAWRQAGPRARYGFAAAGKQTNKPQWLTV